MKKKSWKNREKLLDLLVKTGEFTPLELGKIAVVLGKNRNKVKKFRKGNLEIVQKETGDGISQLTQRKEKKEK